MSIIKEECERIRVDKTTYGGPTYYVTRIGSDKEEALCFRPSRGKGNTKVVDADGRLIRCDYPAGRNTDHLGYGACSRHGGGGKGEILGNPLFIMSSKGNGGKIQKTIKTRIDEFRNKDKAELYDLTYELSTVRAIFEELVERLPDPNNDDFPGELYKIVNLVGTIGSLVDKISRIESRNTMTVAQVLYLRTVVADILMKFITDPEQRELAARELAQRVGGTGEYARVLEA